MTRKETTTIALKCFAIYLLSQVLIGIPSYAGIGFRIRSQGDDGTPIVWLVVIPILTVLFALVVLRLLWKTANSLPTKEVIQESDSNDLSADSIMKVVLVCMGVYFAIDALIAFPYAFVDFQISSNNPSSQIEYSIMNLVTQIIEFSIGCILIAKPSKWVTLIKSIKEK